MMLFPFFLLINRGVMLPPIDGAFIGFSGFGDKVGTIYHFFCKNVNPSKVGWLRVVVG
jgi:hypothetical protein